MEVLPNIAKNKLPTQPLSSSIPCQKHAFGLTTQKHPRINAQYFIGVPHI